MRRDKRVSKQCSMTVITSPLCLYSIKLVRSFCLNAFTHILADVVYMMILRNLITFSQLTCPNWLGMQAPNVRHYPFPETGPGSLTP
jgi:hypothetical protein